MSETISVNMGDVKEKNPLPKGVYTFTFKDSKAFLVRSKKEGSDWIGLQGVIVPEGHAEDAFTVWLAANKSMSSLDAKKFLKGLGYVVDGAEAVKLGGDLAQHGSDGKVNPSSAPQAQLNIDGRPAIPVGFLKFRGETILETNEKGQQQPRLNSVLGRVE